MMQDQAKELQRRFEALKTTRNNWESLWQECADYVHPNRGDFTTQQWQGSKRTQKIFDSTAPWALGQFAAGLHGFLTSPTQRWFSLKTLVPGMDADRDVRTWLENTTDILFDQVFNAPSSRWLQQSHEAYLDIGAFGTTTVFVEDIPGRPITFKTFHLKECFIGENDDGFVDTLYREYHRTALQLAERFGEERLPEPVRKALREKPFEEFKLIHAIFPRKDYDPTSLSFTRRQFASVFMICDKVKEPWVIDESGYFEQPFATSRWYKSSGEWYGRSPSMEVLPDIKMVNEMMKTVIKGAQKAVDPPLQMPDDGFMMPIKMNPAAINYYRRGTQERIEPVLPGNSIRVDIGLDMIDSRRQQIIRSFHTDWMQLQEGPQMTATEVLQRQEDRMRLLSPMVGRMQAEFLGPIISRVFAIAMRRQMIAPPPRQLAGPLKIDYTSPVVQAQKSTRLFSLTRLFETMVPLANVKPEILDKMDADGTFEWVHKLLDAPMQVLASDEAVQAVRQQRAEQQQALTEAEVLQKGGAGVKSIADARNNRRSA